MKTPIAVLKVDEAHPHMDQTIRAMEIACEHTDSVRLAVLRSYPNRIEVWYANDVD